MKKKWIIIVIAVMLAACVALVACDSDTPMGNNPFVNPCDSLGGGGQGGQGGRPGGGFGRP